MNAAGKRSSLLVWGNLILFLLVANWSIFSKEEHLAEGRRVLLEIAKYDPRSLMQGDYMTLTYPICEAIRLRVGVPEEEQGPAEGHVVLGVDADDVGRLRRVHTGESLAVDEVLLHFRRRWGRSNSIRVAAEQFFFQEGRAEEFELARFAELRITADGRTLLVALCDAARRRIDERP